MASPKVAVAITADDKTRDGIVSAQKNLAKLPKAANDSAKALGKIGSTQSMSGFRSILKTTGAVDKAVSRTFGGSGVLAMATSRLGGIGEAASALGTGLGEASAGAGVLGGAMAGIATVGAAAVAVLGAAAFAAYKLADGWAANVAGLGRLSQSLGIATKDIQTFQGAGERAGVEKGSTNAALAGLSQTAFDASRGANVDAMAVMAKLGIKATKRPDGQTDATQLAYDVADAIKRQKSAQAQNLIGRSLGIPDSAMALFREGSAAIKADQADVAKHGVVVSDEGVSTGTKFVRDKAIIAQRAGRAYSDVGQAAAGAGVGLMEGAPSTGRAIVDGARGFRDAVVSKFAPAVDRLATALGIVGAAKAAEKRTGVPALVTLGQYQLESGGGKHMPKGSNNPFGIKARAGEPFVEAMTNEFRNGQMVRVPQRFRKFGTIDEAFQAHANLLAHGGAYAEARKHGGDPYAYAEALQGHYATDPNYARKLKGAMRQREADLTKPVAPLRHVHEFKGLPAGSSIKTKTDGSDGVSIGKSFQAAGF